MNGKEIKNYYEKGLLPQMMEKLNLTIEDILEVLFEHFYGLDEELGLKELEISRLEDQVEEIDGIKEELTELCKRVNKIPDIES